MKAEAPYKIKAKTLKAITELIKNYNKKYSDHNLYSCPLCQIHYNVIINSTDCEVSCGSCPNLAFLDKKRDLSYNKPCYYRLEKYFKLRYTDFMNYKNLEKFWKEVKSFLKSRPAAAVAGMSEGTIEGILEIAEKYK